MRVVTIIGPTGSGKSALAEAMGSFGGRAHKLELSGGVTLHEFTFLDEPWTAVDIAGGPDHMAAAGPAMMGSDVTVLCVPPEADAAVLAAPYLRMAEEADVPLFLFVNKMDTDTERVRDIMAALQVYASHPISLRQIPIREGGEVVGAVDLISERAWRYKEGQPSDLIEMPSSVADREEEARTELLESLSDFDDTLLEELIEDKRPPQEELFEIATRLAEEHRVIPGFLGSAEHIWGVFRLMKCLRHETPGVSATRERLGGGTAVSLAADVRKHTGKMVVLRALEGELSAGTTLGGGNMGALTALDMRSPAGSVAAGALGVAMKSDHLGSGVLLTPDGSEPVPMPPSISRFAYRRMVLPQNERDDTRLSSALARLAEIDTGLSVSQDETTGRAILSTQGQLHAREVIAKLDETFGIPVEEENLPPEYRETIAKPVEKHYRHRKQSGGAGQFADVVIQVAPLPRGTGFTFDEVVKGGAVPRNYIPAVEAGCVDATSSGPNGYRVVDLKVTLMDGKSHAVDSSDYAFRTAGKAALAEALAEAKPVVLQPIEKVDIHVPSIYSGGLAPKISALKGQVLGFEGHPTAPGWDVFSALMPASGRDELVLALGSATRGTAWAEARFDHYEETHDAPARAAAHA